MDDSATGGLGLNLRCLPGRAWSVWLADCWGADLLRCPRGSPRIDVCEAFLPISPVMIS
jgi:hypothetical protein